MNVHSVEILGCQLLALLIHSHLEAFSAASVINLIDVVLFLPAKTNLVKALPNDWATNPQQSQFSHSEPTTHSSDTVQQGHNICKNWFQYRTFILIEFQIFSLWNIHNKEMWGNDNVDYSDRCVQPLVRPGSQSR